MWSSFSRREKMRNRPSANHSGCTGEGLYPVCDQTRREHWQCRGYFTSSCMCSSFFLMVRSGLIRRIFQGSRRRLPHLHFTIHSEALLALRIESRVSDGVWLPSFRRRLVRKGGETREHGLTTHCRRGPKNAKRIGRIVRDLFCTCAQEVGRSMVWRLLGSTP